MSVRIGVIGAGIMGADHVRIVARDLPGAELRMVCDPDGARAKAVAEAIGAGDVSTDPESVIARGDVDAVIVASPDVTHAPLSLACIRAGKKVLCEKPLSQSPAECIAVMGAEAAAEQRFVQLGFLRRYDQAYVEMKQALADGTLGRALMMHNIPRNVESPAADFTGATARSPMPPVTRRTGADATPKRTGAGTATSCVSSRPAPTRRPPLRAGTATRPPWSPRPGWWRCVRAARYP